MIADEKDNKATMCQQKQKQQVCEPVRQQQVSEQQQEQACIVIRDLDSGVASCINPSTIPMPATLKTKRKSQAWSSYWQEREACKHELIRLVNSNEPERLEDMLKQKHKQIDINEFVYLDGWTLLHFAVSKKYYNVILALINMGLDVNNPTQSMNRTALHIAVLENHEQIVQLLLTFGADPNLSDADFCTPIHYASQFGYIGIIKIFLQNCNNINFWIKNNRKMSVMDCCRDIRIRNLIKLYCQQKQINLQNHDYDCREFFNKDKGTTYIVRTRSDFIQRLLNQPERLTVSCGQIDEENKLQACRNQHAYPSLGSKMSKHKLEMAKQLSKQSIISYRDSLLSNSVQSLQNYDLLRPLGSGTFGSVFLIRKKHSSKLFALKRLSKKLLIENKMKKYAYAERQILKSIKNPFVVHGYSFFQDPCYLYMVMDFCAGGDLEKHIRKSKFQEQKAKKYCCQVLLALQELHKNNYLFRDLKASNVLMDQNGHVKLSDFGLAKQSELSHSFLGSIAYLAPQMLVQTDNKPHTAAIDWYLLGVFVYEMVVGLPPFYNENRMVMFEQIKKDKPRLPGSLSPQCRDFILKTMSKKPHQRLGNRGANEVKNHSWFKNIDWNAVYHKQLPMDKPQINAKQLRARQYIEQQQIDIQSSEGNNFRGWDSFEADRN